MKSRILALILAALMTAALCGCGGGESAQGDTASETADTEATATAAEDTAEESTGSTGEAVYGGEITVGIAAELDSSLDPHVSSSLAGTREVLFNIFEGLVKPDTEGNLIPAVAESYTVNETADVYTFTLREGVKFHNGETVTVGDVVYSLTRAAGLDTGEPFMSTLSGIASVEATDDSTIVVTLSAPDTEFLAYMTAAIIPEGNDPDEELIGTGPFKFVSRTVQENVVIEKFDEYWGEEPYLDKVTFQVIEDSQTMVMSLQSGAIDMAAHLDASQAAQLDGLTVLEGSMNLVQALYLNNAVEPFDNILVRQALSYAIDKYEIIDLAGDGYGTALGSSMYPAFAKYFDESLTNYYETDIEKARELLAEAGYEDGFTFTIAVISSYTPHVNAAQVIVEQLKEIGVTVEIEQMDASTWYSDVYQGKDFQATINGFDASTLTASAMLSRFTSTSSKNFISFYNDEYDAAYAEAVATVDEATQIDLFKQCQTILTEQAANVYIQDLAEFVAMQSNVGGYEFYPLYVMDMSTVYLIG
ncbi:MAG: ABC transporter substrate-binding protein [Oscillospiraceae bacterium]|nr:ABC transporter substrate-binding protein [Oscillospiraceae bacterium]